MVYPYPSSPEPPQPRSLDLPLRGATITEAYARYWQKYVGFSGRASRSEYWWVILANFVISIVLGVILRGDAGNLITSLWNLANLLPGLAVGARRLHDINKSGWWQLLAIIPIIGWIILIVWFASRERPEGVRFDR